MSARRGIAKSARRSNAPPAARGRHGTRVVFLSALGVVLVVAFASLAVQVEGLIGARGLLPVEDSLAAWERALAARGRLGGGAVVDAWTRFRHAPTLAWWLPAPWAPAILCALGLVASGFVAARRLAAPALLVAYLAYLSLATVGREFLWFQWDALLLEVTLASVLVAPWGWRPRFDAPVAGWWLLRWILFRLVFFGGLVKLTGGDPTWWGLTALTHHFETQPLPNPLSWHAHRLPRAVLVLGVIATLIIELVLVFGGRRGRLVAFVAITALMALLALTGSYGFFQVLTIVLALSLLDDGHLVALLRRWQAPLLPPPPRPGDLAVRAIAGGLVAVSLVTAVPRYLGVSLPEPLDAAATALSPFRAVNHYGLFEVMTTERPIPILEVRFDDAWTELGWRWQTSDPARAPAQVAPHMPRLDWQLWFAGLRPCEGSPWLAALAHRVLQGSEPVEGLIGDLRLTASPRPPDAVRVALYRYRFVGAGETGWWARDRVGLLCPEVEREDVAGL